MVLLIAMLNAENKVYEIYMKTFHILTIVIATIVFSGLFIYLYIKLREKDTTYTPVISNCPDFWKIDSSGNCIIPTSGKNIGNLESNPIYYYNTFSDSKLTKGYSFLPEMKYNGMMYKGIPSEKRGYTKMDIPDGLDPSDPTYINFNDIGWSSDGDTYCKMQHWSNMHGIQWDGIKQYKC